MQGPRSTIRGLFLQVSPEVTSLIRFDEAPRCMSGQRANGIRWKRNPRMTEMRISTRPARRAFRRDVWGRRGSVAKKKRQRPRGFTSWHTSSTHGVSTVREESSMKLLIASDIHGAASWCERLMAAIDAEAPDRVVLSVTCSITDRETTSLPTTPPTRDLHAQWHCRPGNCGARKLRWPKWTRWCSTSPAWRRMTFLWDQETGRELFLTHGHVYGPGLHNSVDAWPKLPDGAAIVYGHTHVKVLQEVDEHPGITVFTPARWYSQGWHAQLWPLRGRTFHTPRLGD